MRSTEVLTEQLALDYCCSEADVRSDKNVFTVFTPLEGRRRYRNDLYRPLSICAVNGKLMFTGDEEIIGWCRERYHDTGAEWFFEFKNLKELEHRLNENGCRIRMAHPFYIADEPSVISDDGMQIRIYRGNVIEQFRGDGRWDEAYAFAENAPDVIGAAVIIEGGIAGMAGASADSPLMRQIGINVLPQYRGRGIAKRLVAVVKNLVLEEELLPFYGTSFSHLASQRTALSAGFRPAWTELSSERIKKEDK
ncbi:MAG: GNAT family N-acetyltransferase [Oscillospiraceae bacterium]|nr:GNAT family N-acetyltransferase [Oscillospiraceae bacterium]